MALIIADHVGEGGHIAISIQVGIAFYLRYNL